MSDAPAQLEYSQTPPWHRRRRTKRIVLLVVVAMSLVTVWTLRPAISRRVQLLYWQRQCLNYSPPDNGIVFDSDKKIAVTSDAWNELYALLSPPGKQKTDATLYLGEMIDPHGNEVLVSLEMAGRDIVGQCNVIWNIVDIGRRGQPPKLVRSGRLVFGGHGLPPRGTAVYGQVDPDDPSHLILQFDSGHSPRIMDVWLRSPSDLAIEYRTPATPFTPPSP